MKRVFSILFFAALLLTSCKEQNNVLVPSWFTNENYYIEKNTLYQELPITDKNIVMVGDDYIDRAEWALFFGNNNILNRGIALDGAEHVRCRIGQIAAQKPAKIFVSAGMRDILHGTPANEVIKLVKEIMSIAVKASPTSALYYISTLPTGNMNEEQLAAVAQVNSEISKESEKGKFSYIDAATPLTGEAGALKEPYSWNGINLNGAGYELYAKALEEAIGTPALNKANDKVYPEVTDYYKHRVSIFNSLPQTEGQIVMLGNSLNNNAPWGELFPFVKVLNRGISGDVVEGVYNRLDDVIAQKPCKVFLLTATNDFINNPEVTASQVFVTYEKIIKKLTNELPNAIIYVQSVLPLNPVTKFYEGFNARAAELNRLLAAAAESYNMVAYLDIAALLSDGNGDLKREYTTDGIHLSATGYFIWAAELAKGGRMMQLPTVPEISQK